MTLGDQLARLLEEAGDVDVPVEREYAREGVTFASRPSEDAIELRLGAEIAEAAMRTPDVGASERGADWIRFAPRQWNEHAADRLAAWFRVAWRLAAMDR